MLRWAGAVEVETDLYLKLLVLLELTYGWRPENQLAHARWRWVTEKYGIPAFVTKDGDDEGFKKNSRIVAYIPPIVAEALTIWRNYSPYTQPDDYILPRRPKGKLLAIPHAHNSIWDLWTAWEDRNGLKHLPPVAFRHWVKHTCNRLSDPALAALQGHKPPKDPSQRNTYDTPGIEAILQEQRTKFPYGALGALKPPLVVEEALEAEMVLVKQWKDGRMGLMDLMNRLEALQRKARELLQP